MNTWLMTAAGLMAVITGLHIIGGGRAAAAPLLASNDLHFVATYTNYYCWHLVTIMLAVMAGSFGYAALYPGAIELAVVATMQAAAFTAASLAIVAWRGKGLWALPQWALFLPVAIIGLTGLI